ncbi:nuclear protein (Sgd1), putative [Talaromyces stipitatus ATCC 10500]|uniref:Nuclear protein (Sgd1), putative n=1 Tax=Talaromyces stipitatus (strain ATCC 10500 / CBS 375.48 / QM 6759 / NRRL 1006) TaxID=441959 RepID=B8MCK6_TALSN|nr:nuclear protein (Sgd1), putative [Talaromyces stipitatus ATCC 10500]EED18822.1 nuclear protein (Sgd1), putative [Talaromyces stipitatus ATCC 10500]
MPRPRHLTTALPRQLREELGLKDRYGEKKRNQNRVVSRKERRKEERHEKKHHHRAGVMNRRQEIDSGSEEESEEESASEEDEQVAPAKGSKSQETKTVDRKQPECKQPTISKTVRDKLAQDDKEIEALEKRLGIKGRNKLPKSFEEDGLADLLGDIGEDSDMEDNKKRKREEREWLQRKRRRAQGLDSEGDEEASDAGSWDGLEESAGSLDEGDGESDEELESEEEESEDFEGYDEDFESEVEVQEEPKKERVRENPYIAPPTKTPSATKYVPPSLRVAVGSKSEEDARLRRQTQGLLNKLSEANVISILNDVEKLYRENPRQSVTSTLVTLLLTLITDRAALQDTFIILHAGFIAGLYKLIGMDFGAMIIQTLIEAFDKSADERGPFTGKEQLNLVSLLSQLYNFHVVGSNLVFDYIRLFLEEITERNTEFLLKIIRNSGPQLRQDDPSSLKDIVLLIQPAVSRIGESSLSVRTKFMIDTITDLKNNRMKTGAVASSITSEHITKMRKILGSLNNRNIRATEPIRVSRSDIQNSERKGKWWLVGASWKESDPLEAARQELSTSSAAIGTNKVVTDQDSDGELDLVTIAKAHRMNTDVRRSIFVAIMSATDYRDAHARLLKLRLKKNQEYEIPRVLVHCSMEEEAYNPYYHLIARRLCGELGRRIKMSFMFTLWDVFKRLGETNDLDEGGSGDEFHGFDEDNNTKLDIKSIVNLSKMYGNLISDNSLNLAILKNLNFAYLQPKTRTFVEVLIITIFQQTRHETSSSARKTKPTDQKKRKQPEHEDETKDKQALLLTRIFAQTHQTAPHIVKGLIYFMRKVVAKSDIVSSSKEKKLVKWGCGIAVNALTGLDNKNT